MIKYVELNYNEIATHKILGDADKFIFREKLIVSCEFIRKQNSPKINESSVQFKRLQKENTPPIVSCKKPAIEIADAIGSII